MYHKELKLFGTFRDVMVQDRGLWFECVFHFQVYKCLSLFSCNKDIITAKFEQLNQALRSHFHIRIVLIF